MSDGHSTKRKSKKPSGKHPWVPYREYLQTKWWKTKRKQKLRSVNFKCERCGRLATLIHHKHYRSLWMEKNRDLEALCSRCHNAEHECLVQADAHLRSIMNPANP